MGRARRTRAVTARRAPAAARRRPGPARRRGSGDCSAHGQPCRRCLASRRAWRAARRLSSSLPPPPDGRGRGAGRRVPAVGLDEVRELLTAVRAVPGRPQEARGERQAGSDRGCRSTWAVVAGSAAIPRIRAAARRRPRGDAEDRYSSRSTRRRRSPPRSATTARVQQVGDWLMTAASTGSATVPIRSAGGCATSSSCTGSAPGTPPGRPARLSNRPRGLDQRLGQADGDGQP